MHIHIHVIRLEISVFLSNYVFMHVLEHLGPGLAIRLLGAITKSQMDILREADDIMIQEIQAAGVYRDIGQAFCVLLPVKSVGVMGDGRTYEQVCAIRCVQTTDFMTADWYHMDYNLLGKISSRIINEVCMYMWKNL